MEGLALRILWAVVDVLAPILITAIATGLVALVAKFLRRFKIEIDADKRARYLAVVEKQVRYVYQCFTRPAKDKSADGKLTAAEAKECLRVAVDRISADLTGWYRATRDDIVSEIESFIGALKIAARLRVINPLGPGTSSDS